MTDLRGLQRALFRLSLDPALADAVGRRDPQAASSLGLATQDLDLLLAAPAGALRADRDGRRLAQFRRNVGAEMALSVAWGEASGAAPHLAESFPSSHRFHECVAAGGRLPEAFAGHVLDQARTTSDKLLLEVARLEAALVAARRGGFTRPPPPPRALVLSTRAEVLRLAAGTFAAAAALRAAVDAGTAPPVGLGVDSSSHEDVLVSAGTPAHAHALAEVTVEELGDLAGEVLHHLRVPCLPSDLDALCLAHDATSAELAGFLEPLVREGLVVMGPAQDVGPR